MQRKRPGYTLIELLVVISLIAVLAALTMAFFPSAAASARESRAGMNLQGWLNVAKQRALRDQA
ncbi:MAG: prepilin-type N-terminal cleavage/methylation domain-containing protein, partial [Planctomycetes bacterium]|nr:prepilin-type N-terminal cleavage/methylation domain-containing protein [Planctomycetota bacterium]